MVGVVFAGLIAGWWAASSIKFSPRPAAPSVFGDMPAASSRAPDARPAALLSETNSIVPNPRWNRRRNGVTATETSTNWQDKIEAILQSEDEEQAEKAKQLLALFPGLPVEGQVEAAQHLTYMLTDENYPELDSYITNSATAEPVLEVLVAGLLGRPDAIKLPLLLTIAQDEQHPQSEEALNYLEGFLGQNLGTNWQQWSATVDQRLRQPQTDSEEMAPELP
jgi:hypothetical protein